MMIYKNDTIHELRSEINSLKERISSTKNVHQSGLVSAILNYLEEIEVYLSSGKVTKFKLDEFSYGIFRQVTDDYQLEQSSLGQGLLNISVKIREVSNKL